ncbi:MAG TPA: response regulator transcription factor [Gemmatimonadales bacterium]|nr:response regulator transcription factor [Gemmatimonadales bacterium]
MRHRSAPARLGIRPTPSNARPAASIPPARLLLVGGDPVLDSGLCRSLELDGYLVELVREVPRARAHLALRPPQLVIIGADLVGAGGSALLRQLRGDTASVPCVVLSSNRIGADHLQGFILGWDEFLVQPVSVAEVHTRIEWLIRRTAREPVASITTARTNVRYTAGDLVIDPATRMVIRGGREVRIRPKEFDLLLALARGAGRVLSRAELLRDVWGYSETVFSRTVDAHVLQLRRKLETNPAKPHLILTCLKAGYRLAV